MASGEVHRTQLAHERTYLAWWRTGLAGIAAGFGIGRVLPEVVSGTNWPYIALGTALAGAGLAAIVYGIVHYRELQAALREEREPHTGEGFLLALAAVGIAVGAVSVLLVLLSLPDQERRPLARRAARIDPIVSYRARRGQNTLASDVKKAIATGTALRERGLRNEEPAREALVTAQVEASRDR